MNVVARRWIAFLVWAILTVLFAGSITILVGSHKQYRQKSEDLEGQVARMSAAAVACSSVSDIPEMDSKDAYANSSKVLSLRELPTKEGESSRYFMVEVSSGKDSSKFFVFRAEASLVADYLKEAVKCAMPSW